MNDESWFTDAQLLRKRLGTYLAGKVVVTILESVDYDCPLLPSQVLERRVKREDSFGQGDDLGVQSHCLEGLEEDLETPSIPQEGDPKLSIPHLVRSRKVS